MIIVVTVIAIIVSHHSHYQQPASSRWLSTPFTLMRAGGNVAEASSLNTLLSLTPCLIFSPFYHSRSWSSLSVGRVVQQLAEKRGQFVDCVFIWKPQHRCVVLLFWFYLQKPTSVTKDSCNQLETLPLKYNAHALFLFSQCLPFLRTPCLGQDTQSLQHDSNRRNTFEKLINVSLS